MTSLLRSWLGLDAAPTPSSRDNGTASAGDALRDVLAALDQLDPERARYLARFAYLLGRIAHADQQVSEQETHVMERLVRDEGHLPDEQALLVVGLAKANSLLFGGTDNFLVARDFAATASEEQKLALLGCLFAVSAVDGIGVAEEREIRRIARELRIEDAEVTKLRLAHRAHLPGLGGR